MFKKLKEILDYFIDQEIAIRKIDNSFRLSDIIIFYLIIFGKTDNFYASLGIMLLILIRFIFVILVVLKINKYNKNGTSIVVTITKETITKETNEQ